MSLFRGMPMPVSRKSAAWRRLGRRREKYVPGDLARVGELHRIAAEIHENLPQRPESPRRRRARWRRRGRGARGLFRALSAQKAPPRLPRCRQIEVKRFQFDLAGLDFRQVENAQEKGLDKIFKDAGFEWRNAGCSMCLAMNPDKLIGDELCASSSNRNFKGRQEVLSTHDFDEPCDGRRGRHYRKNQRRERGFQGLKPLTPS